MKKQFLVPALVAPLLAIFLGMLIVGIVAVVYSVWQPLETNQAGLLLLLSVLPTIGLVVAYGVTALIVLPVFHLAIRCNVSGLRVLLALAVVFALTGYLCLMTTGAPKLMAVVYGAGLLLPCSVGGALIFWFIYLRLGGRQQGSP